MSCLLFVGCQEEIPDTVEESNNTNTATSGITSVLKRVAMNSSVFTDDFIDGNSCYQSLFRYNVNIGDFTVNVNGLDDYFYVGLVLNQFDARPTINYSYPFTVQKYDYTQVVVDNELVTLDQLNTNCDASSEGLPINCVQIQYPITVIVTNLMLKKSIRENITSNKALFDFISQLGNQELFSIQYPITIKSDNLSEVSLVSDDEAFLTLSEGCQNKTPNSFETIKDINSPVSEITSLLRRLTMNGDVLSDDFLDKNSCYEVVFPYTVLLSQESFNINIETGFKDAQAFYDENNGDVFIGYEYPLTIRNYDYSEVELDGEVLRIENFQNDCNLSSDELPITCIEIEYPITIEKYTVNPNSKTTITITTNKEFFEFIENLGGLELYKIKYPVNIISEGSTSVAGEKNELLQMLKSCF